MACSLPVILLLLVEVAMRLGGYGYDTDFFRIEKDRMGKRYLVSNERFTYRFFSPELARWPVSFRIPLEKPAEVQRIFIFGESAAMGDPQASVGASHYLGALLREKFPGRKFEIVNLGITAINSHVILPIARDVSARGRGDFWLVYMGNNEMVGPFGAATVFGAKAAPMPVVKFNLAVQQTRLGQWVVATMRQTSRKSTSASWGGMRMFLENQVPPDDVRRDTVYQNFDRNLHDLVQVGHRSGAKVVLSTISVNLRDCPPFGSLLRSSLPPSDRTQFESLYSRAVGLQTNDHPAEAAQMFEQASKLDPNFAELQFRWAWSRLSQTNTGVARAHFQNACDADALPFRANTRINEIIRSVAREQAGDTVALCDAEAELASAAPAGVAGDESFFEHVHFNFDGNYRLARAWAEQIARLLPDDVRRGATEGWGSQADCERAIGLSIWNRSFVISSVLSRMEKPPLAAQFNNPVRARILQHELEVLDARQHQTNALAEARSEFESAVTRTPDDPALRENFGNFLEAQGDLPGALTQYLKINELMPQDYYGCLQAGRVLGEMRRFEEAKPLLRIAAGSRPSLPEPWFELGTVLAGSGGFAEALSCFQRVSQMRPEDGGYLVWQARMLAKLNRHGDAIQKYRDSLKLEAESWEPHLELAGELEAAGRDEESLREYSEVVRLNPQHVVARINHGVMLARYNRMEEAIREFETALALDPNNTSARDYLKQVSARLNSRR